jgi:hypothetical protein
VAVVHFRALLVARSRRPTPEESPPAEGKIAAVGGHWDPHRLPESTPRAGTSARRSTWSGERSSRSAISWSSWSISLSISSNSSRAALTVGGRRVGRRVGARLQQPPGGSGERAFSSLSRVGGCRAPTRETATPYYSLHTHAPDQTPMRLLRCDGDLAAPSCYSLTSFHGLSRAAGPK